MFNDLGFFYFFSSVRFYGKTLSALKAPTQWAPSVIPLGLCDMYQAYILYTIYDVFAIILHTWWAPSVIPTPISWAPRISAMRAYCVLFRPRPPVKENKNKGEIYRWYDVIVIICINIGRKSVEHLFLTPKGMGHAGILRVVQTKTTWNYIYEKQRIYEMLIRIPPF